MKIQFRRFDHVQVCIPRGAEGEAREFYGRLLGLEEIEKPEALKKNGGMWYSVADVQLHVGVEETVAPSKRHPAFDVDDAGDVGLVPGADAVPFEVGAHTLGVFHVEGGVALGRRDPVLDADVELHAGD